MTDSNRENSQRALTSNVVSVTDQYAALADLRREYCASGHAYQSFETWLCIQVKRLRAAHETCPSHIGAKHPGCPVCYPNLTVPELNAQYARIIGGQQETFPPQSEQLVCRKCGSSDVMPWPTSQKTTVALCPNGHPTLHLNSGVDRCDVCNWTGPYQQKAAVSPDDDTDCFESH